MNAATSASNGTSGTSGTSNAVNAVNAVNADTPETPEYWIVMDGTVVNSWMDQLHTVLDNNNQLCLNNGESIPLHSNMHMIFETDCLANVTPATVSRLGIVHVPSSTITWDQLFEGWVQRNQKKEGSLSCNWDKSMVKSVKDLFQWLGKWVFAMCRCVCQCVCRCVNVCVNVCVDHLLLLFWLLLLFLLDL